MPQEEYVTPGDFNSIYDNGPNDGDRVKLTYNSHETGEMESVVGKVVDVHDRGPTAVITDDDRYEVEESGLVSRNGLEVGSFHAAEER